MPPFGIFNYGHGECSFDTNETKHLQQYIPQYDLQLQQQPQQRRTVRFSPLPPKTVRVRCLADIPQKERRAVWWTSNDLKLIKQRSHQIVKDVQRFGSSDQCMRGLENLYDKKRRKTCRSTYAVVLQHRAAQCENRAALDEQLALDYAKACRSFAKLAHRMGKQDAKIAALPR